MTHPTSHTVSARDPSLPKGNIKSLRRLYSFLKPYRGMVALACVALLFTSGAVLGLGAALRYLVDEGIGKGNLALLDDAYIGFLAVVFLLAGATFARYYCISWVGERVVADIRNAVYAKIIHMHVGFFETTRTGELLSRITTDTTLIQTVVGSSVSIFLRNLILFFGGTAMLIITSMHLTNYVLLILPLVVAPIIILGKRVRALSRQTQESIADISAQAEESFASIRTVHALALEQRESSTFDALVETSRKVAIRRIAMRALLTAIVISLVFGAIVTVLWVGGRDVISGDISPGDLSAFIFYAVVVAGALGALSEVIGEMQRAAGAAERLMGLLEETSLIAAPDTPTELTEPVNGSVSFSDVTFAYPSRPDTQALEQFNLDVNPGETVAIVGPSGAGKSTIMHLLLRYYDPQQGGITLDHTDIRELCPQALRHHIGIAPQDPVVFSTNGWNNIRVGRIDASDEDVLEAAKLANALDFLEAMPDGLNTFLGEKGVRLSGGQRQRLAIARAIIRNPRILLLDEATSALDSENEKLVQQALERVMQNRTTIVIAHRLSTVQKADRIIVLDQGSLIASGTHETLLNSSPLYTKLAQHQFAQVA